MKLHIPEIGTQLRLTREWSFNLFMEHRNDALMMPLLASLIGRPYHVGDRLYLARHRESDEAVTLRYRDSKIKTHYVHDEGNCGASQLDYPGLGTQNRCPKCHQNIRSLRTVEPDGYVTEYPLEQFGSTVTMIDEHNLVARVNLPPSTVLTVDRIYIRKGASDYSSISFYLNQTTHPLFAKTKGKSIFGNKGRARFWAKLDEVNEIYCDIVSNG